MSPDRQLLVSQLGFGAALLPMILHKTDKPEFVSAIWTALLGLWMIIGFARAELWEGALGATIVCVGWFILVYQRCQINRSAGVRPRERPFNFTRLDAQYSILYTPYCFRLKQFRRNCSP